MTDVTAGNTYRVDAEFLNVSTGASALFGIIPKKGVIIQIRKVKTSSKDVRFALYENRSFTGGDVSTKVFNADASVSDQSIPEDFIVDVVPDVALIDDDIKFFQVSYEGSSIDEDTEYTLKAGVPYIIELKNRTGQNASIYTSIQANMSR